MSITIGNKRVLAIIPARKGSKGIPRKNVKILCGKPLISYTIEAALRSKYIQDVIISTDDVEVQQIAASYGLNIPFLRPSYLATDRTSMLDVVNDILWKLETKYDYFILLQPTSPLRNEHHIDEAFNLLFQRRASSLVSFCLTEKHPFYMYRISENGNKPLIKAGNVVRRQDLDDIYALNGAIYIFEIKTFFRYKKFVLPKSVPFVMERKYSVDIDDLFDFALAEMIMKESENNMPKDIKVI